MLTSSAKVRLMPGAWGLFAAIWHALANVHLAGGFSRRDRSAGGRRRPISRDLTPSLGHDHYAPSAIAPAFLKKLKAQRVDGEDMREAFAASRLAACILRLTIPDGPAHAVRGTTSHEPGRTKCKELTKRIPQGQAG